MKEKRIKCPEDTWSVKEKLSNTIITEAVYIGFYGSIIGIFVGIILIFGLMACCSKKV